VAGDSHSGVGSDVTRHRSCAAFVSLPTYCTRPPLHLRSPAQFRVTFANEHLSKKKDKKKDKKTGHGKPPLVFDYTPVRWSCRFSLHASLLGLGSLMADGWTRRAQAHFLAA